MCKGCFKRILQYCGIVYMNCLVCVALFIVLQLEPREASKLINVAYNYKIKCDKVYILIPKTLNNSD